MKLSLVWLARKATKYCNETDNEIQFQSKQFSDKEPTIIIRSISLSLSLSNKDLSPLPSTSELLARQKFDTGRICCARLKRRVVKIVAEIAAASFVSWLKPRMADLAPRVLDHSNPFFPDEEPPRECATEA